MPTASVWWAAQSASLFLPWAGANSAPCSRISRPSPKKSTGNPWSTSVLRTIRPPEDAPGGWFVPGAGHPTQSVTLSHPVIRQDIFPCFLHGYSVGVTSSHPDTTLSLKIAIRQNMFPHFLPRIFASLKTLRMKVKHAAGGDVDGSIGADKSSRNGRIDSVKLIPLNCCRPGRNKIKSAGSRIIRIILFGRMRNKIYGI